MLWYCPIPKTTLSSGADYTLWEITAAANIPVKIHEIALFFFGVDTVQSPIELQGGKCSSGGTATTDNPTTKDTDAAAASANLTYKRAHSANATFDTDEPGMNFALHPQSGILLPLFKPIVIAGGDIWALLAKDPGTSTDYNGYVLVEE